MDLVVQFTVHCAQLVTLPKTMHSDGYFGMQITQGVKSQVTEGFGKGGEHTKTTTELHTFGCISLKLCTKKTKFNRYELLLHWERTLKTHT